jgi:uncharacterized membrane protein
MTTATLNKDQSTGNTNAVDRMVVVVFDDEKQAYEASKALKDLHAEDTITLYASAVVAKDADGNVIVKQAADRGLLGSAVGLATGSLIGLLGGPVGLALGAATGITAGSMYDMDQLGVDDEFLADVSQYLSRGKTAVVAEVDESWTTPLDTRMDDLGGMVFRRARGDVIDEQKQQELAADKAALADLKAERDRAVGEAKAKLQAKVDAAQKKLQQWSDALRERHAAIKREGEAKIKALEEQAAKAKGEAKAKLQARVAEARAHHKANAEKLSEAWQHVKEAAAL